MELNGKGYVLFAIIYPETGAPISGSAGAGGGVVFPAVLLTVIPFKFQND